MRQPWTLTPEMFLSEGQARGLLRHVREQERRAKPDRTSRSVDRLIVEILLFTGLRNSELCGLRAEDVRRETGAAVFTIRGPRGRVDRHVYAPVELSGLIRSYLAEIRPALQRRSSVRSPALILNERGNPYDRTALYRRVVRILTEAGLGERASVQLLRHTCGYLAYLRTGGNLLFVQRQLGHAHPMVTAIYAQFVEEDYGRLANQMTL